MNLMRVGLWTNDIRITHWILGLIILGMVKWQPRWISVNYVTIYCILLIFFHQHSPSGTFVLHIVRIQCLKKFPPLYSVTLSNLNRFSKFSHQSIWNLLQTPPRLSHVATLPWEIKNFNFLQIFNRHGRKCK